MNSFGNAPYRHDIEQYIKEHKKVSKDKVYQIFGIGRDIESFQRELAILVDKSKLAFTNTGGEYYIDLDDEMFIYESK